MNTVSYAKWVIKYRWLVILATINSGILPRRRVCRGSTSLQTTATSSAPRTRSCSPLKSFKIHIQRTTTCSSPLSRKDGNVFTPKTLAVIEELTHEAWQVPFSLRVDSITNYQHTEADGDDLMVGDLVKDATSLSAEDIVRIKKIALR